MLNSLKPEKIPMDKAEVTFYKQYFADQYSQGLFLSLEKDIHWKHEPIKLFGKSILQPRLTAYHGEKDYPYSGITMQPLPWTATLLEIKSKIEEVSQVKFNAVLLNLYRDGNDSIGWHSDDERELAEGSVIASLSLGATRRFIFRRKDNHKIKIERELSNGDLLIMRGETQRFWQHQVPKTGKKLATAIEPRINLTFRVIR